MIALLLLLALSSVEGLQAAPPDPATDPEVERKTFSPSR